MDELLVEKEEIRGRIARYQAQLATPEHNDDEHLRLQLKIARLELEINGYVIVFNNAIADGINLLSLGPLLETIQSTRKFLLSQQQQERTQQGN
jgi:hypothetical protein